MSDICYLFIGIAARMVKGLGYLANKTNKPLTSNNTGIVAENQLTKNCVKPKCDYLILSVIISLITTTNFVFAGSGDAGAAFLKIPVDAKVCAMGEAGVAYIDNASALYYNPSGLEKVKTFNILFMHNAWLLGMNHEYFAGAYNFKKIGTFGIAFNYWGSGDIQGVTIRGDTIPGYYFSASDWTINIGYGQNFGGLSFGGGFKFLSEHNESLSTSAIGFDIGAMFKPQIAGLGIGASISNIGTSIELDQEGFPLPVLIRLGWRYNLAKFGFTQDLIFSNADKLGIGLGMEYQVAEILAIRFGYRTGSDVNGLSGLRAGLGISLKGFGINYAVAPYGKLGTSHRISIFFTVIK